MPRDGRLHECHLHRPAPSELPGGCQFEGMLLSICSLLMAASHFTRAQPYISQGLASPVPAVRLLALEQLQRAANDKAAAAIVVRV